ncbi:hypothetical protein EC968_009488 [Mortierella alpina]|nr:hypothetical protein EC968_009488 [Mortierella alpina]
MTPQHCSRIQRLFLLSDLDPILSWIYLLLSCCCEFWLTTIAAFTSLTPALEPLEALLPLNYPLNMQDRDSTAKGLLAMRALPTFARARYARSRALLQSCALGSMWHSAPCSLASTEQALPLSTSASSCGVARSSRNTLLSPLHNMHTRPSRSLKSSSRGRNRAAGLRASCAEQQPQQPRQSTSIRRAAFHGLPLEIIHHIALFLPFHDLVKVFKSLPAIHRPVFQQQLDRSLALLMLTLEFQQNPPDVFTFRPASNNPWESALAPESTILQTHWRVTEFDSERMWMVFELEEKLGLEAAERRRSEILHQQMLLRESSSSIHEQSQYTWEPAIQGFHDPTSDPTLIDSSSSRSETPRFKRPREPEEDLETRIWRARRNMTASGRTSPEPFQATDGTDVEDLPDSNFFFCNGSPTAPAVRSATVSFKAHRNIPAPWLSNCCSSFPAQEEASVGPCPAAQESAWTVRAHERIAAFQQNRVLVRSLAKLKSLEDSQKAQFLPTAIELDTRELGLKKVEAIVLDQTLPADPDHGQRRPHSASSRRATAAASAARKSRRHSWHQLSLTEDTTSVTPTVNDEQCTKGFSTVLKRILKAPSWSDSLSILSHTEQQQQQQTRWSIDGSGATDWSTILSDMALSMYRSSVQIGHQGSHTRESCVIVRTVPAPENEFSMHYGPIEHVDHEKERRDFEQGAMLSQGLGVKERQLFELTYDIRHNYLHTSRLEGERVVRPIRFACSLDFFLHDSALTNSSKH